MSGTRHDPEQKVLPSALVSHPHLSPPDILGTAIAIPTMMSGPIDGPPPRANRMTTRTSLAAKRAALRGREDRSLMRIPTVTSRPEREGARAPSSRTMSLCSLGEALPEVQKMILAQLLQVQSRTVSRSRGLTMRALAKALEMNQNQRAQTMRPQTEAQSTDQMTVTRFYFIQDSWGGGSFIIYKSCDKNISDA